MTAMPVPGWLTGLIDDTRRGVVPKSRRHVDLRTRAANAKQSAVLVLFGGAPQAEDLPDDAGVVLLHRPATMRKHSGQIAFPGGRIDDTDPTPQAAALREAWEETGVDITGVAPLATLPQVHIPRTNHDVHPVLAYWQQPSTISAVSPQEADWVEKVPLQLLLEPSNRMMLAAGDYHGPAFRLGDFVVWGFTAAILDGLIHQAGWELPWNTDTHHDLLEVLADSANGEAMDQLRIPGVFNQ
ncbi:NUDIX hydrolase [Corynebacterium ulceribovis]|uniref:NUDIX hydrolase n=1 Tax=Corynebacterium ulceribovis TaxID=487732 RepID=UPI0003807235|nr:NUDIX domain-containing protein [Corynebacterium ulceribovis]